MPVIFCGAMILGAILFLFRSYNPPDAQARHRRGDDLGADEAGTAFVGIFAAEERSAEVDDRLACRVDVWRSSSGNYLCYMQFPHEIHGCGADVGSSGDGADDGHARSTGPQDFRHTFNGDAPDGDAGE